MNIFVQSGGLSWFCRPFYSTFNCLFIQNKANENWFSILICLYNIFIHHILVFMLICAGWTDWFLFFFVKRSPRVGWGSRDNLFRHSLENRMFWKGSMRTVKGVVQWRPFWTRLAGWERSLLLMGPRFISLHSRHFL